MRSWSDTAHLVRERVLAQSGMPFGIKIQAAERGKRIATEQKKKKKVRKKLSSALRLGAVENRSRSGWAGGAMASCLSYPVYI